MKQRLFVAIAIPSALKRFIGAWQREHNELPARFIAPKNLHLTIIPPWYADAKKVISQLKKFTTAAKPFSVQFETIECGPDSKRPRLVWAKGKASKELTSLHRELAKFLGIKTEHRPLIPHITIARFRHNSSTSTPGVEEVRTPGVKKVIRWTMQVNSFVLMQSHLSRKGASYDVLAELPLS